MKIVLGLLLAAALLGCGAASSEEAQAAQTLAPKPPTADQKAQMDRIKSEFPQAGSGGPGRS